MRGIPYAGALKVVLDAGERIRFLDGSLNIYSRYLGVSNFVVIRQYLDPLKNNPLREQCTRLCTIQEMDKYPTAS